MYYDEPNQEIHVYAFDFQGKRSGIAANLRCDLRLDNGELMPLVNESASEIENTAEYVFQLEQAETKCLTQYFSPWCTLPGVQVYCVAGNIVNPSLEKLVKAGIP